MSPLGGRLEQLIWTASVSAVAAAGTLFGHGAASAAHAATLQAPEQLTRWGLVVGSAALVVRMLIGDRRDRRMLVVALATWQAFAHLLLTAWLPQPAALHHSNAELVGGHHGGSHQAMLDVASQDAGSAVSSSGHGLTQTLSMLTAHALIGLITALLLSCSDRAMALLVAIVLWVLPPLHPFATPLPVALRRQVVATVQRFANLQSQHLGAVSWRGPPRVAASS